jgi:hypothetical protein
LITTDLNTTSPDAALTVIPPDSWTVEQFVSELAGLKSDASASQVLAAMTNDPTSMTQSRHQADPAQLRHAKGASHWCSDVPTVDEGGRRAGPEAHRQHGNDLHGELPVQQLGLCEHRGGTCY